MEPGAHVILADLDREALDATARRLDSGRVTCRLLDASDATAVAAVIREESCDVVVNSVPWQLSLPPLEAALETGTDFVDYGLYQNREFDRRLEGYDGRAREAGITVVPSCGFAPGLTNMLAGYGAAHLDQVQQVHLYVGGLPENPKPPLQYSVVWSLEGVWTQYFEDCRIVRDGILTAVEAGSEREYLEIPAAGRLEAAMTDGLGTLLHMYSDPIFDGVQEVFEKTLRHPGHYDRVMTLKDCGLLDSEPVDVGGVRVSPRALLTAVLTPRMTLEPDQRDMTVMRVRVAGQRDGRPETHIFDMVDYRDLESGTLSMGRTTGYTGSIVALMLKRGLISQRGVVAPERLGADRDLFEQMLQDYAARDITVSHRVE